MPSVEEAAVGYLKGLLDKEDIFKKCGLVADDWQKELLECQSKRYLVNCSRQAGKSITACALALNWALVNPYQTILFVSPSERQSKENLRTCLDLIRKAKLEGEITGKSQTLIEFRSGSRILGLQGGSPDTLRGYSVDLAIIDEAAFVLDALHSSLAPMLATRPQAVMICLSTPNGAQGFFYRQWTDTKSDWRKIEIPATIIKRIPPEFLEAQRRELGDVIFEQEYLCKFISDETLLIEAELIDSKFEALGAF